MRFEGLHSVADYAALYAALRQEELGDRLERELGEYTFGCDTGSGEIAFTSRDGDTTITATTVLIATIAPDAGSILWGWAHPDGDPNGEAARLRDLGHRHGISDLRASSLGLPVLRSETEAESYSADLAHVIGAAGVEATGISPYYSAPIAGGGRAVFVLRDLELPEPSFADFAAKAPRLLPGLQVTDPRLAVHGLVLRRGWQVSWNAQGPRTIPSCHVTDGTSNVVISFDDRANAMEFHTTIEATSEPESSDHPAGFAPG
ncbi:DUF6882 domain-containing protein [Gordonia sp. CPCC 206044]|uniref:DUF6882 domain-containing protein n=1 Tax=Gordonia sp. CPCC 206044 TaxID=3140793 RepID=UPI003AF3DB48